MRGASSKKKKQEHRNGKHDTCLSVFTWCSLPCSLGPITGPPSTHTCLCSPCIHCAVHTALPLALPAPTPVCVHLVFTALFPGPSQYPHLSVFTLCSLPCSQGPITGPPSTHTCLCTPCIHCVVHRTLSVPSPVCVHLVFTVLFTGPPQYPPLSVFTLCSLPFSQGPNTGPPSTHTCPCSQGPPSILTCLCSPCVHCRVHRARSLALPVPTPVRVHRALPVSSPVFTLCSLPCSQGPITGSPSTHTCLCSPCVHCLVHRARTLVLTVPVLWRKEAVTNQHPSGVLPVRLNAVRLPAE